jgi:hypothetical protein
MLDLRFLDGKRLGSIIHANMLSEAYLEPDGNERDGFIMERDEIECIVVLGRSRSWSRQ